MPDTDHGESASVEETSELEGGHEELLSQLFGGKDVESVFAWSLTRREVCTCCLLTDAERLDCVDRMRLHGSAWTMVLEKMFLAYSYGVNERHSAKVLPLIAECYIPMMPTFSPRCSLIDEYRQALRFVLDDWYAFRVCSMGKTKEPALLKQYLKSRPSFSSLSKKQRAAVLSIKAKFFFSSEVKYDILRQAMSLNRAEGQWRLYLGEELGAQRRERNKEGCCEKCGRPSARELELLRAAARLRPGPETSCSLAECLILNGEEGEREAREILEDALKRWPDNIHVVWVCFSNFRMMHRHGYYPFPEEAEELPQHYQQLLAMTGDCGFVHAMMLTLAYQYDLGPAVLEKHFRNALRVNPAACRRHLEHAVEWMIPADPRGTGRQLRARWRQLKGFLSEAKAAVKALEASSESRGDCVAKK